MDKSNVILFEPWSLGDAIIATAIALQDSRRLSVACDPRWHALLRDAAAPDVCPDLVPVQLDYTRRQRVDKTFVGKLPVIRDFAEVLTVRGDPRDWLAARTIFKGARLRGSGWLGFAARRAHLLDFPYAHGWLKIQNQYRAWAAAAGVPWQRVDAFYLDRKRNVGSAKALIHVGARWRSKQFPHVAELTELLTPRFTPLIAAGPGDKLPPGIAEAQVRRLIDGELIREMRESALVIVNDSGPMHLAALLGCRVLAVSAVAALAQWIPPRTAFVEAPSAPIGYHPVKDYLSDDIITVWPSASELVRRVQQLNWW